MSDNLSSRWSEAEIEDASRIVNDIAEDMDNPRDTRKKLRQALAIYADLLWDANVALSDRRASETMLLVEKLQKAYELMEKKPNTPTAP